MYYTYTDYLGSLIALTNESGTVVERYAYDPWGARRNPTNWTQTDNRTIWIVNRGYTMHEHLDAFSIINMNGRVYDPLTAQFFSPDPYVQAPDNWLNFNRYAYAFGNPFKYTDPDGEWIHIVIGAVIGGVINLATNWNNVDGFWDGLAAFGAGAGSGALTAAFGPLGALGGGALTGATNNLIAQTGKNFSGFNNVNWGQVALNTGVGGVAGIAGYGAGQWAANHLGGIVVNGFQINSQSVWAQSIYGAIGGAGGGYAGGFTGAFIMTGDLYAAHQAGISGMKFGAAIGAGTGFAGGLYSAKKNGLNPWTGKPKNSVTIGEGMSTNTDKGWMGIDKISEDLGSSKFEPNDLPLEDWYTDSKLMKTNGEWIDGAMQNNATIYDRGSVGNNSQYYNMEVGRTMNYPVMKVTPYYNRTQTIRVLIIRK